MVFPRQSQALLAEEQKKRAMKLELELNQNSYGNPRDGRTGPRHLRAGIRTRRVLFRRLKKFQFRW